MFVRTKVGVATVPVWTELSGADDAIVTCPLCRAATAACDVGGTEMQTTIKSLFLAAPDYSKTNLW